MALEPHPSPAASTAIENEIPAYRAISPLAIVSLILGLLSLLSFTDAWFLALSGLAVVAGLLADRKIQRMPDVFTGRRIAQAGMALGLIFGLSSITVGVVQSYLRKTEVSRFGRMYAELLEDGSVSACTWYRLSPYGREEMDPESTLDELKEQRANGPPGLGDNEEAVIEQIKTRLSTAPEAQHVHLDEVEQHGIDRLEPFAILRLRLEGPASGKYPEVEYAMLFIKGSDRDGKRNWWIDQFVYPYNPGSQVVKTAKPADDGHGHAH